MKKRKTQSKRIEGIGVVLMLDNPRPSKKSKRLNPKIKRPNRKPQNTQGNHE